MATSQSCIKVDTGKVTMTALEMVTLLDKLA